MVGLPAQTSEVIQPTCLMGAASVEEMQPLQAKFSEVMRGETHSLASCKYSLPYHLWGLLINWFQADTS